MTGPADSEPGALRRMLQRLPAAERRAALLRELGSRAARLLLLPAADALLPSRGWLELGFDSLRAMDFCSDLEAQLALPLRSTLLFDQPTPAALAEHLLERLALPAGSPAAPPATMPASGPTGGNEAIATDGAARPEKDVVLCVGDSSTRGAGSSDPANHAYPAVLQALLRERTRRDWSVVNCGWSGQNSRDVLQRLPSQLAEFSPRVVCVQVGFNDFSSFPAALTEGPASDAFDHGEDRFRCHIPGDGAPTHGGQRDSRQGATTAPATRGPEWEPRQVRVQSGSHNQPTKWKVTPESQAHKDEGWRHNATNDVRALAEFELALAAVADDAQTRQMLVGLYLRHGRREAAASHLQWLVDSWARDQDFATGRLLARAFDAFGRSQDAREVAVKVLAGNPEDGWTWLCRAKSEFLLGLHEEASQSITEAIRLAPDRWSYFWRHRIHFLGLGDVDEAIRTIYGAYVVFNDAQAATDDLRQVAASVAGSRLRSVLASFACEPEVRARLDRIVEDVVASNDRSAAVQVLSEHLRRIARTTENAGATPVFVPYHFEHAAEDVMRTVAAELDVAIVGMSQTFAQRTASCRWEEARTRDGHCNDAGYRIVAAIVADALQDIVATT